MLDLTKIWKQVTDRDAVGEVSMGYETVTFLEGCCDMCRTEVTDTVFYLLNDGERARVSNYDLNIVEL